MGTEKNLQRRVLERLKEAGGTFRKRHGTAYGMAGDPDIYGLLYGRHVEIELKRPGAGLTKLQAYRLEEWRRAGALTGVVHNLEELEALMAAVEVGL
jgi:hypothetical protein